MIFLRQKHQIRVLQERHTWTTWLGRGGAWPRKPHIRGIHDLWIPNVENDLLYHNETLFHDQLPAACYVMVQCTGSTKPFTTSNWVVSTWKQTNQQVQKTTQAKQWGGEFNAPFLSPHHLSVSLSSLLGSRSTCARRSANLNAFLWSREMIPGASASDSERRDKSRAAQEEAFAISSNLEVVKFRGKWCEKSNEVFNVIKGLVETCHFQQVPKLFYSSCNQL